ncbi:MAG: DNA repair protein RadA [Enterococcus sp.]|nr:DNA repair protein RadA [Enterococcus sp.]
MAAVKKQFSCTKCGEVTNKWMGKCPKCKEWDTLQEVEVTTTKQVGVKSKGTTTMSKPAQRVKDIDAETFKHRPTGIGEFDRVLGGGIVAGAAILLAGPPGVGKSSILATVAHQISKTDNVLYVSGEETVQQIKIRHERMNAMGENLYLAGESDLAKVLWQIDEVKPKLMIIDSMQTIASGDIEGRAGAVSQVVEVATILTRIAKERNIPVIFVGHYTKDGNVAGPRVVEHLVDVVLAFEGEDDSPLRLLRGIKNRFGAADEIGCFEHTETGLEEVPDPSGLLLGSREGDISGIATSIYLEGKRAMPVEVQALVMPSALPNPRKVTSGLDAPRTMMLSAVLQKHGGGGMSLADKDVYVSTVAGMRIKETAVDLATIVALTSSQLNVVSRSDAVCIGEVTLSGEIRRAPGTNRRLAEAVRLGFTTALVPFGTKDSVPESIKKSGLTLIEIKNVSHAVSAVKGYAVAADIKHD